MVVGCDVIAGVGTRGNYEYKPEAGKKYVHVFPQGSLYLPAHFAKNAGGTHLNQFTITMEVRVQKLPATQQSLVQFPKSEAKDAKSSAVRASDGVCKRLALLSDCSACTCVCRAASFTSALTVALEATVRSGTTKSCL